MASSASKVAIWNRALGRIGQPDRIEAEGDGKLSAATCRQHYEDVLVGIFERLPWTFARRQATLSSLASQSATHAYDAALSTTQFDIPFAFSAVAQISVVKGSTTLTSGTDYNVFVASGTSPGYVVLAAALTAGQSIVITGAIARTGFVNVYGLPADCVAPLALLAEGERPSDRPVVNVIPFTTLPNDAGDGLLLCTDYEQDTDFEVLEYTAKINYVPLYPRLFVDALVWKLAEELALELKRDAKLSFACAERAEIAIDQARVAMLKARAPKPAPLSPALSARR